MEKVARKILEYIENKIPLNEEQRDYVYLGLQLILESLIEVITILIIALILGIFIETLVIVLVAGVFKLISGGAHCTTFGSCYTFSIILYPLSGIIANYMIITNYIKLHHIYILFSLIGIACFFYAPSQISIKPIADELRLRYKVTSLLFVMMTFIAVLILYTRDYRVLSISISIAMLFQAFFITPLGFYVTEVFDTLFAKLAAGKGGGL